jgi:hypothetical protein
MTARQVISRARRTAFLAALAKGLPVAGAAAAAGVNRTLLYKWRTRLPSFAAAWDDAVMTAIDRVEDEALRRAMHGVERPVLYRGKQVGNVTTYNDRMLMLLLERRTGGNSRARVRMPRCVRDDRVLDRRESVSLCLSTPDCQISRAAVGTTTFEESVNLSPPVSQPPPVIPGAAGNLSGPRGCHVSEQPNLSPTVSLSASGRHEAQNVLSPEGDGV